MSGKAVLRNHRVVLKQIESCGIFLKTMLILSGVPNSLSILSEARTVFPPEITSALRLSALSFPPSTHFFLPHYP